MRPSIVHLLALTTTTTALTLDFQPFFSALPQALLNHIPASLSNETSANDDASNDLLKRQYSNTCPEDFNDCANLGAPQYCCAPNAVCSADFAGHVACCPRGAACSGTIGGIITEGTMYSDGQLVGGGAAPTGDGSGNGNDGPADVEATTTAPFGSAQTSDGLVLATSPNGNNGDDSDDDGDGDSFVMDGSQVVATPAAGMRSFEPPLIARAIIKALEYIPL
ncbi:hypothetical protein MBLNU230_g1171t1 [Neophaeotheca triangularis]